MTLIKKPNVSGSFYPSKKSELNSMLDLYLDHAKAFDIKPKAIIAPHAGYLFSAPIAATAYKTLSMVKDTIKNVVILSPSHFYSLRGMAISNSDYFETPLGTISVNKEINDSLLTFSQITEASEVFEREHALEVHLPFLQKVLKDFTLTPIIVGPTHSDDVREILEYLSNDPANFFVISTDLSHFHDYDTATLRDKQTSSLIENKNEEKLDHEDACGYYPLKGLLLWAASHNYSIKNIDLRNSGDTAGDKSRVVGYGSYVVF